MKQWSSYRNLHFIGIGGIGMSALARFFLHRGVKISGYDRVEKPLTSKLLEEGVNISFHPNLNNITDDLDAVIYSSAISDDFEELVVAKNLGLIILKRAELLGDISESYKTIGIAGTHGKTTTSIFLADMIVGLNMNPLVILGGINRNWSSNFHYGSGKILITEADEYDRSFLTLKPSWSIINSLDADHLDVYKDADDMIAAYSDYIRGHKSGAEIFVMDEAMNKLDPDEFKNVRFFTFGFSEKSKYRILSLSKDGEETIMKWTNGARVFECKLPLPGRHNALNTIAALAFIDRVVGKVEEAQEILSKFTGIARRYEERYNKNGIVIIDDYAHHPTEVQAVIATTRGLFPNKKLHVVFQAHLYSRTRDFMEEFARVLSDADVFYSCELYPAREAPIEGISGKILFDKVKAKEKIYTEKLMLHKKILFENNDVVLVLGAGDINTIINELIKIIE